MNSIAFFSDAAIAVDKKFIECRGSLNSPFVHSYPCNCCELISVHLGLILQESYPNAEVQVAIAYNRGLDKQHYWVEMEALVIDLTAHQFGSYSAPLICAKSSPLELCFPDVERLLPSEAEAAAEFDRNLQIMDILKAFMS